MTENLIIRRDISKKDRRLLILLMFLPCLLLIRSLNNDIWFLLNSGRYVLEHGIPYIEPFTIHQGLEFVMQQWLSALIFWVTYSSFGILGLDLLIITCYALIIYILYKLCMRVSEGHFFISFTVTLFASLLIRLFMVQRPYSFSMLIFMTELYLLESFLLTKNRKYMYFMPVLSALLINLHAAMWPIIFIIIAPYVVDSFRFKIAFLSGQGYEKKTFLLVIGAMLFSGLLNPYGINAMTYLIRSYGYEEISNLVAEMNPPNINTVIGMVTYGSFFVVLSIYLIYRKGATKLRYTLLSLGTAYMALSSIRSLILFAICGLFPLAYYLKDLQLPTKQNEVTRKTLMFRKIMIVLIVIAAIFSFYSTEKKSVETNSGNKLLSDTINFILEEGNVAQVKLYTGYNDGGMAEFMGIPPYIDARAEVFVKKNNKKEDIMLEYVKLLKSSIYYKDFLDKYQFTHLIVTKNDSMYINLLHDKDFKVSFSNKEYTLYEKKK